MKSTTVPFLHSSSTLKADDSLSKADSIPWISTQVIITKPGDPHKGYMGVVTDVLRGHDTASGLRIEIQLLHFDPSSPYRKKIVDHDDVVEHRSVKDLYLQESILNVFFKHWISTFGLCRAPKRSLSAFKVLHEVCVPAFQTSTTSWGISFRRSHPNA